MSTPGRPLFRTRKHEILSLHQHGATTFEICRELGITQEAVRSCIRADEILRKLAGKLEPHPILPDGWHERPLTYFIYALGAHAVKIGFTANGLAKRMGELSTGSCFELIPCAVIMGDRFNESLAHRHLVRHRIRGEWFRSCEELWNYIERVGITIYQHWIEPVEGLRPLSSASQAIDQQPSAYDVLVRTSITDAFNSAALNSKEREILGLRFGLDDRCQQLTLEEVGRLMNLTRERVRQLESRSIEKLSRNRDLKDLAS